MKVIIQLSAHEAYLVSSCLDFVSRNLVYDENSGNRRFVGGGLFSMSTKDQFDVSYLVAKLDELREDAINYHPFNPYLNVI